MVDCSSEVPTPWSQGYGVKVVSMVSKTSTKQLKGLGPVRLDTCVAGADSSIPSPGHWAIAWYVQAAWERAFLNADLLHGDAPWK
jgi:hypothetical protein